MDVQNSGLQESRERWRAAVAGVLAKSTRRDPADLLPEPEGLLDSPTYEGFPIRALYTSLDARPEAPLPGDWPFIRGGDALRVAAPDERPVAGQRLLGQRIQAGVERPDRESFIGLRIQQPFGLPRQVGRIAPSRLCQHARNRRAPLLPGFLHVHQAK